MRRVIAMLLVAVALVLGSAAPVCAQSGDQGPSLGEIARALRAKKKLELPVITNDNFSKLPQLIRRTEQRALAAGLVAPASSSHSEPEITCSFAFSAQAPSALAATSAVTQDLPAAALAKLDGPAVISGDTLQVSLYNGSNWEVREITVGITIVRRENQSAAAIGSPRLMPASVAAGPVPMLKKADETILYHLKGSAPPASTTAFKQALGLNLGANDEWHWSILQARGLPPLTPVAGQ